MLRRSNYGDADLVVTLLGRDNGKITAFARSARRSKRRFGAALSWFSVSEAQLSRRPGKELFTLIKTDLVQINTEIASDVATLGHASYATELVRELIAAEHPEPALFDLLLDYYATLRANGASRYLLRCFELATLNRLGLAPNFEQCVRCGTSKLDRGAVLDAHGGGIACTHCAGRLRGHGVRPIGQEARRELADAGAEKSLTTAAERGCARIHAGVLDDGEREAQRATAAILSRHLSSELRSLDFIAKMNAAGNTAHSNS